MEQTLQRRQGFAPGGFAGWVAALWRARERASEGRVRRGLEVRETLSLGARRQIALVSCGGREFLVGMGAESVDTIVPLMAESVAAVPARVRWEAGF